MGWSDMTKEERSAEMIRRQEVARQNREAGRGKEKKYFTKAGRLEIQKAQRERWRLAKRAGRGKEYAPSTASPFPSETVNPQSIRARLEAIEAALAQLKSDVGF